MKAKHKQLLLIFAIGIVLYVVFQQDGEKQPDEASLQQVLSSVEGVGEVRIYYEQGEKETGLFSSFSSEPQASTGILIVCEGASSQATTRMIVETVSAVLDIAPHQIKVLPLHKEER
jgi:hypothetical protein